MKATAKSLRAQSDNSSHPIYFLRFLSQLVGTAIQNLIYDDANMFLSRIRSENTFMPRLLLMSLLT